MLIIIYVSSVNLFSHDMHVLISKTCIKSNCNLLCMSTKNQCGVESWL